LQKAEKLSIKLLQKHLLEIKAGTAQRIIQDHTLATLYPKRSPEDGLINWQLRSDQIRNFIRAQSRPYPGAFTIINGMKIIIYEGAIGREMSIQPGQIFHKNEKDKKVIIGCGQNTTLEVSELEFEGIAYKAADILKDQELIQTK
jgi:methionyl-tRNA formyltransferase